MMVLWGGTTITSSATLEVPSDLSLHPSADVDWMICLRARRSSSGLALALWLDTERQKYGQKSRRQSPYVYIYIFWERERERESNEQERAVSYRGLSDRHILLLLLLQLLLLLRSRSFPPSLSFYKIECFSFHINFYRTFKKREGEKQCIATLNCKQRKRSLM